MASPDVPAVLRRVASRLEGNASDDIDPVKRTTAVEVLRASADLLDELAVPSDPKPTLYDDDPLVFVGLYCDKACGTKIEADVRAATKDAAYVSLREDARAAGWRITDSQDVCPLCAASSGDWYTDLVELAAMARISAVAAQRSLPNLTWDSSDEQIRDVCRAAGRPIIDALISAGHLRPPVSP